MTTIKLYLPITLYESVRELAKEDNISINQFITLVVAEKMPALMTEYYLSERASRASRARFDAALAKVPDVEADEHDQR
jgi:hypothetical protein